MKTAVEYIEQLDLEQHPEGGWYKEVYRSDESVKKSNLPDGFNSDRSFCTSIYFLLEGHEKSVFHRIKSDETWHFYAGTSITISEINDKGELKETVVGGKIEKGELLQYTVPKNTWFAAEVNFKFSFSLLGCTVSPGFDFEDFEMADKKELTAQFPKLKDIVKRLTK